MLASLLLDCSLCIWFLQSLLLIGLRLTELHQGVLANLLLENGEKGSLLHTKEATSTFLGFFTGYQLPYAFVNHHPRTLRRRIAIAHSMQLPDQRHTPISLLLDAALAFPRTKRDVDIGQ